MQSSAATSSSSTSNRKNINNDNSSSSSLSSSLERSNQILKRFLDSIRSEIHRKNVLNYINAYMRFYHLYEGESQKQEQQDLLNDNNNDNKNKSKKNNNNNNSLVYRYDWLVGDDDIQTIENRIIDFVTYKRDEEGIGANGIDNYINQLQNFYRVNGVKGIDWKLIRRYRPDHVKKTQDREYRAEEVIAIEEKLDVRGKVISGIMRGSGVRIGGVINQCRRSYSHTNKIWQDIQNLGLQGDF